MARLLINGKLSQMCGTHRSFHVASAACMPLKMKVVDLQDCYTQLGVAHDCKDHELKVAYLEKVKSYHPDSGSSTADSRKFIQVKEAYRTVLEHRKGRKLKEEEEKEAEVVFDIKHTAPQHRQYLEFEGVGAGTPSQRQRQYQQYRVKRVTENVFQHRIQRLAAATEDALVLKNKQEARKTIISNAIERLCEDMIQESMKRGEFDNLSGAGRRLEYSAHNPFVDATTHNINKILVNNGFAPEWIMLQSEIRKELRQARQHMALMRQKVGSEPTTPQESKMWRAAVEKFKRNITEVNIKINKFNLIVPFLNKQQVPYTADRELKKVIENFKQYLPNEEECVYIEISFDNNSFYGVSPTFGPQKTDWRQVWKDIKSVFMSSPATTEQPDK